MRVMDVLLAFPAILLAIGIMAMVGPGVISVIEAISVVYIPIFARVSRAPAIEQMTKEYVEAERSLGASTVRILFRHVLVNIWPIIIIQLSLAISDAILIEAALSYLGLGVVPPAASLGELLRSGQSLMFTAPWLAIFPGVAIALAVLGFNVLGDAARDHSAVRGK
jgi:peptide/nickel transport system permease protein